MNNNPRIYLWIALALVGWLNYQAWMTDYGPRPGANTVVGAQNSGSAHNTGAANDLSSKIPQASKAESPGPADNRSAATSNATSPTAAAPAETAAASAATAAAQAVHVHTDVLDLDISTLGATISRADLLKYTKVKGEAALVRLENDDDPLSTYLLQSGLIGPGKGSYPTHLATWSAAKTSYDIDDTTELRVPFTWTNDQGVTVTKTYTFHRGLYSVGLEYSVQNHGDAPWQVAPYAQVLRNDPRTKSSMFNVESRAFHGPAMDDGTKYRKLDLAADSEDSHLSRDVTNGWIAAVQHQFISAIVPPKDAKYHFTMNLSGDQYLLAATGGTTTVAPGSTATFGETLYIGPKLQSQLEKISPRLDRVADYGMLTVLAQPLFNALDWVHGVTGNWGAAIILVTLLLKALFYPLSETSGRSMAKMKLLSPRIKNLQETYKDDRDKLGRAMMDLYKREKVNPATGCLPMIIQIPVFFAFYQVLLESVEMRQAPFAFWIHDLSARDPLFILPAIMAAAMFMQYKLNPTAADPVQQKVFMIMPLVMSFTFAFFPAGLVLYWVTNTLLSIAQQWNINRRIAAAAAKKN
ncbi:MAG TPA: membrane protein insertase YidC [Steroidobacteraceae bacterium]|nr:membrane protein insertase YidC [Steroidobacteraceae bacterium]